MLSFHDVRTVIALFEDFRSAVKNVFTVWCLHKVTHLITSAFLAGYLISIVCLIGSPTDAHQSRLWCFSYCCCIALKKLNGSREPRQMEAKGRTQSELFPLGTFKQFRGLKISYFSLFGLSWMRSRGALKEMGENRVVEVVASPEKVRADMMKADCTLSISKPNGRCYRVTGSSCPLVALPLWGHWTRPQP